MMEEQCCLGRKIIILADLIKRYEQARVAFWVRTNLSFCKLQKADSQNSFLGDPLVTNR